MSDDISTLRRILAENRVVAMVSLSASWYRPSHFAAKYLHDHDYRAIPVYPRYEEVLGQRCYRAPKDIVEPVDVVDRYRPARDVPPLAREKPSTSAPRRCGMQPGIVNEEAAPLARGAGLEVIMDRCMKIVFARLIGGLRWVGVDAKVIMKRVEIFLMAFLLLGICFHWVCSKRSSKSTCRSPHR